MGTSIRHDHHQQRHPASVPTTAQRDQQFGARATVGPGPLAQTDLATKLPSGNPRRNPENLR